VRAGVHQALAELRAQGLAVAVVSNFDRRLHNVLHDLALTSAIDLVVLPADAGAAKPDPALLLAALARLDCAPSEAALVGDDPERDFAPALRLGIAAIDVRGSATLAALPAQVAALGR
jgi:putative hydrolase of the HAD superfamily